MLDLTTQVMEYYAKAPVFCSIFITSMIIGAGGTLYYYFHNKKVLKDHLNKREIQMAPDRTVNYNTLDKHISE